MKYACLVNYNHDPADWWVKDGYEPHNVVMYDRSDDGVARTFDAKTYKTRNIGNVDYDKLGYLIEHYYDLPDVFLWAKSNLFKYITKEEWDVVKDNQEFTPLLTRNHLIYTDNSIPGGLPNIVNAYDGNGMYYERYGIVNHLHTVMSWKYFRLWEEWCAHFRVPQAQMIPFPPGGNFILTRERVHRYGVDFYKEMREVLDYAQLPVEAYLAERSYFLLWK